jgi:formate--tetrahydrofolate ligase
VVTTVRALKAQSGRHRIVAGRPLPGAILEENPEEVHIGGSNLRKQIENVRLHGVTPVVAINAFPGDFASEHAAASLREKVETLAVKVYGADGVDYSPVAARQLDTYKRSGFGSLPVCVAKTRLSISSDPSLKGPRPAGACR